MQNEDGIYSVLKLNKLVFDYIEFKRLGFQKDNKIDLKINQIFHKEKILIFIKSP